MMLNNVHEKFIPNDYDKWFCVELFKFKGNQEFAQKRLVFFKSKCEHLTNYGYWFMLSTLWVEYTGFTSLSLWRELFSSNREDRECLMKPNEINYLNSLPEEIIAYRAHRKNEKDYLSLTLDYDTALRFLKKREGGFIKKYLVKKEDIVCVFLRRGEFEIITLNKKEKEL